MNGVLEWARRQRFELRAAAWLGLAVLVFVRVALAALPLDPLLESTLADVLTYLSPMALVVAACAFLAVSLPHGVERRFWGVLTIAIAFALVGESHWTWYAATIDFHGPPIDSPVRISYVIAALLFIGLMISMTRLLQRSPARRVRLAIDLASGMFVGFALTYALWSSPAALHRGEGAMSAVQFAVYPVLGMTVWVAVLGVLFGWKATAWRSWERLLVTTYGLVGAGLVLMPVWYDEWMQTAEPTAGWITLLMGGGMYLHFIAAVYRASASESESLADPLPLPEFRARLYPVLISACIPLIGWLALQRPEPVRGPIVFAVAALAVLLVARSWFVAIEIAHHRLKAVTDDVTGAYNDRYLRRRLDECVNDAHAARLGLVVVEVTDYVRARHVQGRASADRMLSDVATMMLAFAPSGAEVFRLDEGRLAALLPETGSTTARDYAAAVVVRTAARASMNAPVSLALFAGVANYPEHAADPDGLLACAITALEAARRKERGNVAVFESGLTEPEARSERSLNMRALRETVRALAAAVDARDHATRHHSANCAELATALAEQMGLEEERVQLLGLAALVHDVGKIGVSDDILLKPGPLTPEERLAVQEHCELGRRILEPANLGDIMPLVRHHHERWDGEGYPDGLAGEEIPIEARIMAVCDTYETLTAGRPYRQAVSAERALLELEECSGSQFDPVVVHAFRELMQTQTRVVERQAPRVRTEFATGEAGP